MLTKRLYLAGLFMVALLQPACQTGSAMEEELKNEVIKVHDRIMPRTAEIIESKKALHKLISGLDTLKQTNPGIDTGNVRRQADSVIRALDAADDAMSEWMYGFKTEYSKMKHEEIMIYLNEEKKKISEIERAFDSSLKEAQKLLANADEK